MARRRRVYLFGIGSPEWQRRTGHIVNALGVPIAVKRSASSSSVSKPARRRKRAR